MSRVLREEDYLEARYACGALRVKARRAGLDEAARVLGEGISVLCAELRALLAREGRDKVSRVFPSELLERGLDELARMCLESARRLEGSRGGAILARGASLVLEGIRDSSV